MKIKEWYKNFILTRRARKESAKAWSNLNDVAMDIKVNKCPGLFNTFEIDVILINYIKLLEQKTKC